MKLSREIIQRMVTDRVGSGGGGGGGSAISIDDIQGMGFATEQWVNEKYLSIDFFNRLFQAYDSAATPNQVLPNDLESTITNIKAMFGFWTEQFVSALGYGPGGGGGGGADLNLLLDNINSSNIGNIAPTSSEVGKCLVYNGNNQWAWATPGGGGGSGTVTSITAGTGLSGGTITTMGTIAISSTYQGYISHGETAYGWGNHANAGYATQEWVNQQGYVKSSGVTSVGLSMPTGFTVSGSPVTSSGTLTVGIASGYFMPTTTQRTTWNNKQNAISDLATIRSGAAAGATAVQPSAISDMATKTWVEDQGYVTSSGVTSVGLSMPTGFSVSGSPVTTSGTLSVGIASGYFIPTTAQRTTWNNKQDAISDLSTIRSNASHGETAYGWGNHADQGYLLRTEGMRFTSYGNYIAARFVNADGTYDATRAAKAQGEGYIEWWASGGYFNHVMGFIRAKGNVEVGTSTTDTAHYLQIGGGRLFWDNTNNALYVQKADGTAAHFYATGGVSALGMSVGGTPSMNALTLQNLTVNGSATIASLTVRNTISSLTVDDLDVSNNLYMNGCNISMDGGYINNCGTLGADSIETGTLLVGSGSELKKIQWDGTYLQVQIGSTTYKFLPDATA